MKQIIKETAEILKKSKDYSDNFINNNPQSPSFGIDAAYFDGFVDGMNYPSESLILRIQVLVCKWNFGGIDKSEYKDMFEYIKNNYNTI